MSDSLSHMDDPDMTEELSEQKQLLQVLDRDLEESSQEISKLRLMVKDAETKLAACSEELKQMENNKQYPRARFVFVTVYCRYLTFIFLTMNPTKFSGKICPVSRSHSVV